MSATVALRRCGRDHHAGWAHVPVAERVALLHDVDYRALLGLGRLRQQRLVHVRIEHRARLDLLHAVSLEQRRERAVRETHALFELRLLMLRRSFERTLEIVEDRQEILHEPLVRERDELLPLAKRTLAEVVEVGGGPLPAVDRLVALGFESGEAILAALLDRLLVVRLLLLHQEVFASSSTTSYSPSSTTSSSAVDEPLPPPEACACAVACA